MHSCHWASISCHSKSMSMQATHLVVLSAKPASSRALSTTPSYSSTQAHSSPPLRSIHLFELLPVRSQQRQHHHLILGGESLRSNESRGTTEWPGLEGGGVRAYLSCCEKSSLVSSSSQLSSQRCLASPLPPCCCCAASVCSSGQSACASRSHSVSVPVHTRCCAWWFSACAAAAINSSTRSQAAAPLAPLLWCTYQEEEDGALVPREREGAARQAGL